MSYKPDVTRVLYPTNEAADVSGYKRLRVAPVSGAATEYSATLSSTDGEVLLEEFISDALGVTSLTTDTWTFNLLAKVDSGTGNSGIKIYLLVSDTSDAETAVGDVTIANIDDTSATLKTVTYSAASATAVSASDRIVIKFYALTDSTSKTISLYSLGTVTQTRVIAPFDIPVLGDMLKGIYDTDGDGILPAGASSTDLIEHAHSSSDTGGAFPLVNLLSTDASSGQVATANGSGGITWETPTAGQRAGNLWAFGDSTTSGVGASDAAHRWPNIVATAKSWTLTNYGVESAELFDMADNVYARTTAEGDFSALLVGLNDMHTGGAGVLTAFGDGLRALTAWLAIRDTAKIKAQDTSKVTYAGTWVDNAIIYGGSLDRYSAVNGSTATFVVNGKTIYIAMTVQNDTPRGSFAVTVDGASAGTYSSQGGYTTGLTRNYGPKLIRITNLASGPHTVVLTHTGTGNAYFDWAAGSEGNSLNNGPLVYLGNCLRMDAGGYSEYGGSDALAAQYNAAIALAASDLAADGLEVMYADVSGYYDPATQASDNIHPDDTGYANIAAGFLRYMDSQVRPQNWQDSGGHDAVTVSDTATIDLTLSTQALSADLKNTTVTPGSYTFSSITVDAQGRITAASSGTVTTSEPLTNGDASTPEILFSEDGDVLMEG